MSEITVTGGRVTSGRNVTIRDKSGVTIGKIGKKHSRVTYSKGSADTEEELSFL